MSPDRRDDARMDALLRAALRRPPDSAAQAEGCPDPGDLAALAEGALSGAERRRLETHLLTCARCRETLALAAEPRDFAEGVGPAGGRRLRRALFPSPASGLRLLRWLAPAGAALAGVVLYFVVISGPGLGPLPATTEVAPVAIVAERAPSPDAATHAAAQKAGAEPSPPARAVEKAEAAPAREEKGVAGASPGGVERGGSAVPASQARARPTEPSEAPVVRSVPPEAPPQAAAPPPVVLGESPAPKSPQPLDSLARKATETRVEPPGAPVGAVAGEAFGVKAVRGNVAAELRDTTALVRAVSPDGSVEWRFHPDGAIERSSDRGRTWHPQVLGTSGVVTAASAPSPAVCWAVGPGGVVLLTSDGATWQVRPFPERIALVAVQASDARSAIVTTSDGRRFQTADNGATWTIVR